MPDSRSYVVDAELAAYIAAHSSGPDDVQRRLMIATEERTGRWSRMQIGGDQGTLFEMLARAIGARSAIEVGTFTGYSSLAIARGMGAGSRLICCDISEEWTDIARDHWQMAGLADRIDLRIAPALETIESLPADLRFDLAFIDADKTSYAKYYEALLPRMNPTAMIIVDNTLWSRQVLDESSTDADTVALREFNSMVAADARVRCVIVPMGDGVTMIQLTP